MQKTHDDESADVTYIQSCKQIHMNQKRGFSFLSTSKMILWLMKQQERECYANNLQVPRKRLQSQKAFRFIPLFYSNNLQNIGLYGSG
jgi:hypothetical protein